MTLETSERFSALKHKVCSVKQPDTDDSWRAIRYRILCLWHPKLGGQSGHPPGTLIKNNSNLALHSQSLQKVFQCGKQRWLTFQGWGFRESFQQLNLWVFRKSVFSALTPWLHPIYVVPLDQQFHMPGYVELLNRHINRNCLQHICLAGPPSAINS